MTVPILGFYADGIPTSNDTSTCNRKKHFKTKQEAKAAARRDSRVFAQRMWSYECPCCKGWHLTSLDPETERSRRRL